MGFWDGKKNKEPVSFTSVEDFINNMPKKTTVDEETLALMAMHQSYHKYVYDELYVTRGSKLVCTQGTKATKIDLPVDYGITVEDGEAVLTCIDSQAGTNISNFGSCKCERDSSGNWRECMPAVTDTWHCGEDMQTSYAYTDGTKLYQKILTTEAYLLCNRGGYIEFFSS